MNWGWGTGDGEGCTLAGADYDQTKELGASGDGWE